MERWKTTQKPAAATATPAAYDLDEREEAYFKTSDSSEPASQSLNASSDNKNAKASNSLSRKEENESLSLRRKHKELAQGRGGRGGGGASSHKQQQQQQQPRTIRSFQEPGSSPPFTGKHKSVAPTAKTFPPSSTMQMIHQRETKNMADEAYTSLGRHPVSAGGDDESMQQLRTAASRDDEDLLAQKVPAGRAQMLATRRSSNAATSVIDRHSLSRGTGHYHSARATMSTAALREDKDLVAQKMPRYRPASFDLTLERNVGEGTYKDPHQTGSNSTDKKHQQLSAGYHPRVPKQKNKTVVAEVARIVDDGEEEPLIWDPIRRNSSSSSAVPIAHMAEPTSLGQMQEPSTVGEISSHHILPAGKDTVSSYHTNSVVSHMDQDAPTRTAEASVLSYGPIYSSYGSSVVVEASPVNVRSGAVPANSQYEKGYSNSVGHRQESKHKSDVAREKQKLTLENDLQQQQQQHQVDRREQQRRQARQISKIREAEEETDSPSEYSEGVTNRIKGPVKQPSNQNSLPSVREVKKDPIIVAPTQKKMCCLGALFGA